MTALDYNSSINRCFEKNCFDAPLSPYEILLKKRKNFHGKVLRTFSDLPQNSKLKEIARRCLTVVIAPFVYLSLTWKIRKAKAEGVPAESVEVNLEAELKRLDSVLTQREKERIGYTISDLTTPPISYKIRKTTFHASPEQEREMKIIISKALELKKIHDTDHLVITHGQNSQWYVVAQLIKILVQKYDPQNTAPPLFEFIRSTKRTPAKDLNGYQSQLAVTEHGDHDREVRTSIISSDINFWSTCSDESALDYFTKNRSILSEGGFNYEIEKACKTILREYLPSTINAEKITECAQKVQNLAREIHTVCGQLFVICIPKTVSKNLNEVGFLAHSYGVPCRSLENIEKAVEQMQQGQHVICKDYSSLQFRLMTDKVTPQLGAKSFLLNTLTTIQKENIHTKILEAVAALG